MIGAVELRERFNAQDFPAKLRNGEVTAVRTKSWPADQSRGLRPDTFTVMLEYYQWIEGKRTFVAEVHQYQKRGIGGVQTRHDPKQLVIGDALYKLDPGD